MLRRMFQKKTRSKSPPSQRAVQPRSTLIDILWTRASEESADFVSHLMGSALLFRNRLELLDYVLDRAPKSGLMLEFGVYRGKSINHAGQKLAKIADTRVLYGFDSFEGLSEDWAGHHRPAGVSFDLSGRLPFVEPNVQLIKGWVDDTLPAFLDEHPGPISYLHVDTDTYSPCKTILSLCKSRLQPGSIVLFDELFAYPGWRAGEFKALTEELKPESYRWLGFSVHQGAIEILERPNDERA